MTVKLSFDKAIVERRGYVLENVHRTVKSLFAIYDLPCVAEDSVLTFADKGHGDDFAVMWDIILALLRADWFLDCAASCVWQDCQRSTVQKTGFDNIVRPDFLKIPLLTTLPKAGRG